MIAIDLGPEIETRLALLASKTGRTETYYAQQAILQLLEDIEDVEMAMERLQNPAKIYTSQEVKRELGL